LDPEAKVLVRQSAEVALLTRNIVIQGAPEGLIGGHFIVYSTETSQVIVGLELFNMGQQGRLGRSTLLLQQQQGSFMYLLQPDCKPHGIFVNLQARNPFECLAF
jgi:hypothetical protein